MGFRANSGCSSQFLRWELESRISLDLGHFHNVSRHTEWKVRPLDRLRVSIFISSRENPFVAIWLVCRLWCNHLIS